MNEKCTAQFGSQDDVTYICERPGGHPGSHFSTLRWNDLSEDVSEPMVFEPLTPAEAKLLYGELFEPEAT